MSPITPGGDTLVVVIEIDTATEGSKEARDQAVDAAETATSAANAAAADAVAAVASTLPDLAANAVDDQITARDLIDGSDPRLPNIAAWLASFGLAWAVVGVDADGNRTIGDLAITSAGHFAPHMVDAIRAAAGGGSGVVSRPATIAAVGDSMTAVNPARGTCWPQVLGGLLGMGVWNPAVAGEASSDALLRSGVPFDVDLSTVSNVIPGSGTFILPRAAIGPVDERFRISSSSATDGQGKSTLGLAVFDGLLLGGVPVNIHRIIKTEGARTVGEWVVTRITAGDPVPVPAGPAVLHDPVGASHRGDFWVIASGQNNKEGAVGSPAEIAARLKADHDRLIAWLGHDHWVVMPPTVTGTGTDMDRFLAMRTSLSAYGIRFVNHVDWMRTDTGGTTAALELMGITPTSQDLSDIAAGLVPSSLRSDTTHYDADGAVAQGTFAGVEIQAREILP